MRTQLFRSARVAAGFIALFGAPIATQPSFAQEATLQQFEVELIIFRVTNPTGSAEDWQLEDSRAKSSLPVVHDAEDATPITPGTPTPAGDSSIQPLESSHLKMTAIEASLKKNRLYQQLAHIGWTQPGFASNSPRPLDIQSLLPADTGISGTVTLTRDKYLHMVLDLSLQTSDGKRYVLREHRRMHKSGEKHYFDHPYFGVIALVTPKG